MHRTLNCISVDRSARTDTEPVFVAALAENSLLAFARVLLLAGLTWLLLLRAALCACWGGWLERRPLACRLLLLLLLPAPALAKAGDGPSPELLTLN